MRLQLSSCLNDIFCQVCDGVITLFLLMLFPDAITHRTKSFFSTLQISFLSYLHMYMKGTSKHGDGMCGLVCLLLHFVCFS